MGYKTKKRIQGSISVLLVIIMVPMICLSGLIVDGSRVELAKGAITGAGDLTMNAALADYDTVLKEVYGLFAMSQSADDLQANLYNYFVETLSANGIIESEADIESNPLLQDVAYAFSGQSSNLLSMEVASDSFKATKLADSSLANPYVLKNQIVEYEKYRAPISAALDILDGVASLKKILKQSKVNKAKTEVDEKAKEVNENSNTLYGLLKGYEELTKDFNEEFNTVDTPTRDYYTPDYVYYYKQLFEMLNKPIARALAENLPYYITTREVNYFRKDENTKKYTFKWDVSLGYPLELKDGTMISDDYDYKFKELSTENLKDEIIDAYTRLTTYQSYIDANQVLDKADRLNNLTLKGRRDFGSSYRIYGSKVYLLYICYKKYLETVDVADYDEFIKDNLTNIQAIFDKMCEYSEKLKKHHDECYGEFSNQYSNVWYYTHWVLYTHQMTTSDNRFEDGLYSKTDNNLKNIEKINKLLPYCITQLEKVEEKIKALDTANGNLKNQIDNYNGSDKEDSFSKQMGEDYEYYNENVDLEDVIALKERLTALQTYFNDVADYYGSIKFMGAPLVTSQYQVSGFFNSLDNLLMIAKSTTITNSLGITNVQYVDNHLDDGLDSIIDFFWSEYEEGTPPSKMKVTIVDEPFYQYLQKAFSVQATEEDNKAKENEEGLKEEAKNADATGSTNTYSKVTVSDDVKKLLPSQGNFTPASGVSKYDGGDSFSGLFDSITKAVNDLLVGVGKALTAGRDNLYVTQYIFDMFTYNTMENEYILEKGGKPKQDTLESMGLKIKTSSGIEKNAKNNYQYGAEVEYIIYGGFDAAGNIKSAKTTIFCIRFLANAGFALTNGEIRSMTLPPALAVQAATCGIVPYKLVQVVIQLCLALGESTYDLKLMEEGRKVALIKTSDTWTLSPRGAVNAAKDIIKEQVSDTVKEIASQGKGVVSDLINKGTEQVCISVDDFIDDTTIAIKGQLDEVLGNMFASFQEEIVSSLDVYLKKGKSAVGNAHNVADSIINQADQKVKDIINGSGDQLKPILQGAYDLYFKDKISGFKTDIENSLSSVDNLDSGTIMLSIQKKISAELASMIEGVSSYLKTKAKEMANTIASQLSDASGKVIDMAADKILEKTNDFIDSTFDSIADQLPDVAGKKSNSGSLASIIKFNYGDYLKIIVFLKLCVNDTEIVSRIADVIQLNVNNSLAECGYTHPKKGSFTMANAYTYIEIESDVKLKTMFISLPFFTEYAEKGGSSFNLKYKSVQGY